MLAGLRHAMGAASSIPSTDDGCWRLEQSKSCCPHQSVKQVASERAKTIQETQGRNIGRKEMRELCESIKLELLPRAFINRRTTFGWIDKINGRLVIDAASTAKAEEFLEHLHKSVDGFQAKLIQTTQSPSVAMTGASTWVLQKILPPATPHTRLLASKAYPDQSSALKAEYRIKQLKPEAKRRVVREILAEAAESMLS